MRNHFLICLLLLTASASGQTPSTRSSLPGLAIKPAIGVLPWGLPVKGLASLLLEYPIKGNWVVGSHTMLASAVAKNTYNIETNYSLQFSQKFGAGYTMTGPQKFVRLTVLAMGGVRRVAFKETLDYPGLEKITTKSSTVLPDVGLLLDWSLGRKRHTFNTRVYLPFYPFEGYPVSTFQQISIEVGVGIQLAR
ncbi:hypothetical protein [Chitinophaga nivalis]|uniref:Outer membrane protein beta-barrel domain-containing protein n=1 Tax=Chitinophaga nivalis TaxID=2991709 RepID=A0ABT3IME8_9BACT|nr:hypothetical protein [Chitinophaga nivalis]MCW3465156.1 hypothetical protein [Chitinophaga nivalis]MCW3485152.1 hypothetical protein [Chitinophaga nivalis]